MAPLASFLLCGLAATALANPEIVSDGNNVGVYAPLGDIRVSAPPSFHPPSLPHMLALL